MLIFELFHAEYQPLEIFGENLISMTITYDVPPSDSIESLKCQIQNKEGPSDIHLARLRLIFARKQPEDDRSFHDYAIDGKSTIHGVLRFQVCGGPKPGPNKDLLVA